MTNIHATALVAGRHGLLITGASGSGKSALALDLVGLVRACGAFARLVSDDQCLLNVCRGRLIATAPAPIAGLVEARGYGIRPIEHEPATIVDLVVALDEPSIAPRHRTDAARDLMGVKLPLLSLPARSTRANAIAITAMIGMRVPLYGLQ
jgi:serine kinase of HPr protein (carbohydrate metabolism regulator)